MTGRYDVVVTVGTDHHPFDRLTEWLAPWLAANREVRVLHQHGTSAPLPGATVVGLMSRTDLMDAMRDAAVVVMQAGPASLSDARSCGHVPVIVPRRARFAEAVDDHQTAFAQHVVDRGWAVHARSARELRSVLDDVMRGAAHQRVDPVVPDVRQTATRLAAVVEEAVASRRRHQPRRMLHAGRLLSRRIVTSFGGSRR